jgi:putative effector of murein hydrolase
VHDSELSFKITAYSSEFGKSLSLALSLAIFTHANILERKIRKIFLVQRTLSTYFVVPVLNDGRHTAYQSVGTLLTRLPVS